MWKIIQQLCEDIRGNLTVYEAVVLMMTALGSLRCHDKSRVIPVGYSMLLFSISRFCVEHQSIMKKSVIIYRSCPM